MLNRKQTGSSVIETMVVLLLLVLVGRGAIALIPVYIDNYTVTNLVEGTVEDAKSLGLDKDAMLQRLRSKFDVNGIGHPEPTDFKVRSEGRGYYLVGQYSVTKSYLFNITLVVNFEEIRIDVTDIVLD